MKIQFSALKYYNSIVSEECLYVGILFNNLTTGERHFKTIKNFKRLESFDDEIDIEFIKMYLNSIRDEVENNLFNFGEDFNMKQYIDTFVNDMRFSEITTLETDDIDFVYNTCRLLMKYDYDKRQRLSKETERFYIKTLLKTYNINTTSKPIIGKYDESIKFDIQTNNYCIKIFRFKNKDLSKLIASAKTWSFTAQELSNSKKTIFLYDVDIIESAKFKSLINILSENAEKVLPISEGLELIPTLS